MARRYRAVAHIQKTHGNKGKVVVESRDGLPSLMRPGLELRLVPPDMRGPRLLVVKSVEDGPSQLVSFDGIEDLEQSQALAGKVLLVACDDLPADFVLHDYKTLIGRTVLDEDLVELGPIVAISPAPSYDIWHIQHGGEELLFPAACELICEYSERGPLVVRLPEGLIGEAVCS